MILDCYTNDAHYWQVLKLIGDAIFSVFQPHNSDTAEPNVQPSTVEEPPDGVILKFHAGTVEYEEALSRLRSDEANERKEHAQDAGSDKGAQGPSSREQRSAHLESFIQNRVARQQARQSAQKQRLTSPHAQISTPGVAKDLLQHWNRFAFEKQQQATVDNEVSSDESALTACASRQLQLGGRATREPASSIKQLFQTWKNPAQPSPLLIDGLIQTAASEQVQTKLTKEMLQSAVVIGSFCWSHLTMALKHGHHGGLFAFRTSRLQVYFGEIWILRDLLRSARRGRESTVRKVGTVNSTSARECTSASICRPITYSIVSSHGRQVTPLH